MGKKMVLEAHYTFQAVPYSWFAARNKIVAEYEIKQLPDMQSPELLVSIISNYLGARYDYTGIVGGIIVSIGKWLKTKWKNPFGDPKYPTCSESVARGLQGINFPGAAQFDIESVPPQDIMSLVSNTYNDKLPE
jgi:hypothetical protein